MNKYKEEIKKTDNSNLRIDRRVSNEKFMDPITDNKYKQMYRNNSNNIIETNKPAKNDEHQNIQIHNDNKDKNYNKPKVIEPNYKKVNNRIIPP